MSWRGDARRTIPYVVTATGGFLLAYLLVALFVFPARLISSEVKVPDVVGLSLQDATKRLADAGFVAAAGERRYHLSAPAKAVLTQTPPSGTTEPRGTRVVLELSLGQRMSDVPSVVGLTRQQAQLALENAGLELGTVGEADNPAPRGQVLASTPATGAHVPLPSAVNLTISTGPPTVTIPEVVGQDYAQARTLLTQVGLAVAAVVRDTGSRAPANTVVAQQPEGNRTVAAGTTVQLTISAPNATPRQP